MSTGPRLACAEPAEALLAPLGQRGLRGDRSLRCQSFLLLPFLRPRAHPALVLEKTRIGLGCGITVILVRLDSDRRKSATSQSESEARHWIRGGAGDFRAPLLPGPTLRPSRTISGHRLGERPIVCRHLRSPRRPGGRVLPSCDALEGHQGRRRTV